MDKRRRSEEITTRRKGDNSYNQRNLENEIQAAIAALKRSGLIEPEIINEVSRKRGVADGVNNDQKEVGERRVSFARRSIDDILLYE